MAPGSWSEPKLAGMSKTRKLKGSIAHVLHHSTRHNLQTSLGVTSVKGKSTLKKIESRQAHHHRVADIEPKQLAVPHSVLKEESLCLSARKTAVDPSNFLEVDELRGRLHNANLQIAEVVAQSAILVSDVKSTASKKIEETLRYATGREVSTRSLPLSLNTQIVRDFGQVGMATSEQELAVTRQELTDCKSMLAAMKRQLEQTCSEKEKLEDYLRSSLETSLKLQNILVNQKAVMQLELLAAEKRYRDESAGLIQSARNEVKHLQEQLDAALLSKAENDCLLRKCTQLMGQAQRELLLLKMLNEWHCCVEIAVKPKFLQLQIAQEQAQMQRDRLAEASAQTAIGWTVLECVWKGAVQSLLESESFLLPKHNVQVCSDGFWLAEHNAPVETLDSFKRRPRQQDFLVQKCVCSSEDEPTPVKRTFMATPKRSTNIGDDLGRELKFKVSQPEDDLRQSLIKSEQEVEFLGDKVEELRIILEKVRLLLDCISKSSVTGQETRILMRRIIEQLQTFEM